MHVHVHVHVCVCVCRGGQSGETFKNLILDILTSQSRLHVCLANFSATQEHSAMTYVHCVEGSSPRSKTLCALLQQTLTS